MAIEYLGLSAINGPMVVLEGVQDAAFDEIVEMTVEGRDKKIGHSVKGQHGIRNFLCAVLILRAVVRAIRASDPLFLCAKDSHNLAVT